MTQYRLTNSNFDYVEVWLTPTFYNDHVARDLPSGEVWKVRSGRILVALSQFAFNDLLSDARHYVWLGTTGDLDREYAGLVSSARATVRRLEKLIEQGLVEEAA